METKPPAHLIENFHYSTLFPAPAVHCFTGLLKKN